MVCYGVVKVLEERGKYDVQRSEKRVHACSGFVLLFTLSLMKVGKVRRRKMGTYGRCKRAE